MILMALLVLVAVPLFWTAVRYISLLPVFSGVALGASFCFVTCAYGIRKKKKVVRTFLPLFAILVGTAVAAGVRYRPTVEGELSSSLSVVIMESWRYFALSVISMFIFVSKRAKDYFASQ